MILIIHAGMLTVATKMSATANDTMKLFEIFCKGLYVENTTITTRLPSSAIIMITDTVNVNTSGFHDALSR